MRRMEAVAIQNRQEIISLASTGLPIAEIARRFNVQAPAISKHLANDPEYRAARETAAELRLDEREHELEKCPSIMTEISRAGTLLSHQRWRCEREFPHRWGQHSTVSVTVDLGASLQAISERLQGRVIEGDATQHETVAPAQVLQIDDNETVIPTE